MEGAGAARRNTYMPCERIELARVSRGIDSPPVECVIIPTLVATTR